MYAGTLRIDGVDIAPYVHKNGPQTISNPEYGLPEDTTIGGTKHIDYAGHRDTIIIPFNHLTPEQERAVGNLCRGGIKWLTYHDNGTDTDITVRVTPVPVTSIPALTKGGAVTRYLVNSVAFQRLDLR